MPKEPTQPDLFPNLHRPRQTQPLETRVRSAARHEGVKRLLALAKQYQSFSDIESLAEVAVRFGVNTRTIRRDIKLIEEINMGELMLNSKGSNNKHHLPETRAAAKALGIRVRLFRETCELSQRKFALQAGLSPRYLQQIEKGRRDLSLEMLCRLAKACGVPVGDLFTEEL